MARIILTVVFLVVFAILIVMNAGAAATINLFGWQIEDLPVTVVAIVSFVGGVLYSFIFYVMAYLERGRKERLARKKQKLKDQESQLKTREQEAGELAEESKRRIENAQASNAPPRETGGLLAGLFGRRRAEPSRSDDAGKDDAATPVKRSSRKK